MLLIGHVTKEGSLAGPRALEHLVDCVLHFEGERERSFRTVRALKNRFGATSEVGVFEMREGGLVEVADASARFVGEAQPAAGLGRPLLDGGDAAAAGRGAGPGRPDRGRAPAAHRDRRGPQPPRAGARGPGPPRQAQARSRRRLRQRRRRRPGRGARRRPRDRARDRLGPLGRALEAGGKPLACFGEVGLTGELRYVAHADRRVAEARKFGLAQVLGPQPAEEKVAGLIDETLPSTVAGRAPSPRRAGAESPAANGPRSKPRALTTPFPSYPHGFPRNSGANPFCQHHSPWRLRLTGDDLQELEARQDPRLLQGPRHRRPGDRAPGGDRQHRPLAHRRPDRHRRSRGRLLPLLRRPHARRRLHAGAALPGGEDGRRDHPQRAGDQDRLRQRPADARPDDPLLGDRHPAPHRRARLQADRRRWSSRSPSAATSSRSTWAG